MVGKGNSFEYALDGPLTPEQVQHAVDLLAQQVGSRIAELRRMRGWPQSQVCEEHGINPSQISRVESGKQNLTLRTACRFAAVLGVRPWELYVPREQSELALKKMERTPPVPAKEDLAEAALAFRRQVGKRVRELRTLQGMSLFTVESFSGIGAATVQAIERGDYNIRTSTAVRLADAIGVHPYELYIPNDQSGIRLKRDA